MKNRGYNKKDLLVNKRSPVLDKTIIPQIKFKVNRNITNSP